MAIKKIKKASTNQQRLQQVQPLHQQTHSHIEHACCCVVASETAAAVSVLACEIKPGGSVIQQGSGVPIN